MGKTRKNKGRICFTSTFAMASKDEYATKKYHQGSTVPQYRVAKVGPIVSQYG